MWQVQLSQLSSEWVPLDPAGNYTVITSDYLATGHDGYSKLGEIGDKRSQQREHNLDLATVVAALSRGQFPGHRLHIHGPPTDRFFEVAALHT